MDSVVSVAEDNLSGGAKYVGNILGETTREMGKSAIDGKDIYGVVRSGIKGANKGLFKSNAELIGNTIGEVYDGSSSEIIKDLDGNITNVIVSDTDIISTATQDTSNYLYDLAQEAKKKKK